MMFDLNVTSAQVLQVAVPYCFVASNKTATPVWAARQEFSNKFPSIKTRWPFLISSRFLIAHARPAYDGDPSRHVNGLLKWLRLITISEGTSPVIGESVPPNMTFSPAASR